MIPRKYYRINRNIQARDVRVLDDEGKQVGVMAINQALQMAMDKETDLVEVVPKANPPICKLIDFKRFLYIEEKKEAKERKKIRGSEQKEIWVSPFIAENDLKTRVNKARRFLTDGNKLKIVVKFKGREMGKKDFGMKVIGKMVEQLNPISDLSNEPRFLGNRLEVVLSPAKGKKHEETENQKITPKTI